MQLKDVCDIIFKLYLYADSTKLIHYSTDSNHQHELCDQVRDTIVSFADTLAEQVFGYYGKPSYNQFTSLNDLEIHEEEKLADLCQRVVEMTDSIRTVFEINKKLSGSVSLIDDFKGQMSKLKFLSTFDNNLKN